MIERDRMSIKVTSKFKEDDLEEFVKNSLNGNIFQTPDMAKVYERSRKNSPITLVAIDEDEDMILSSLVAKLSTKKKGILSSFSTYSTIRGGPVFRDTSESIASISPLLERYIEIAKKKAIFSNIYPLNDPSPIVETLRKFRFNYSVWNNFLIDLSKPKEELWRNLKRDKRRAVKKAKKHGIKITEGTKDELSIFYDLVLERQRMRRNPFEDRNFFEGVFDILVPKGRAKFLFAKYKDEYIATRLILLYNGIIHAWYVGSDLRYRKYYPNDLLAWHVLEWGSKSGFHTFDFGGAGESHQLNEGWVQFKSRFGGKLVNYGRYTKIYHKKKWWIVKNMYGIYRRIFIR